LEEEKAKQLQALETTVTAENGYSLDKATTKGMKKVWTHDLYTVSAEMTGYEFSGTGQFPNAKVGVKYTFTPKCNGKWTMDWNEDPNYPLSTSAFKDEAGNVLDGSDTKVAGKTYTATVIQSIQTTAYGYQKVSLDARLDYPEIEGSADFTDSYRCDFEYILPLVISTISEDLFVKERSAKSITLDGTQLATIGYSVDSVGIFYKEKSATAWNQATSTTITGLKGNTEYQIKVNYIKTVWANGDHTKKLVLTSPDSNVITVLTDMSAKVDIKSVKTSKAKIKKYKYKGYWWWSSVRNRWVWEKPSTSTCTRFKVTVTIKKKVPGAKGYWINIDGANQYMMPGNKTKCTFYALVKGKRIGKKITVKACAYNRAEGQGMGPLGKGKSVKIKK